MHKSVLLNEAIAALNIKDDGIYVDATLGYAGHSSEILRRLKRGFLFAFDQDEDAILVSNKKLELINSNYKILNSNFSQLTEQLKNENINKVDGILFDLGLSSPQIDDKNRGFSFMQDAKLDMRMNQKNKLSAYEVVNEYDFNSLFKIFISYGEEKFSHKIAQELVSAREKKPITTTLDLVEIIKKSVPYKYYIKNHPERKIFQAIRIEVNQELEVLKTAIPQAIELLNSNGRLVIITFHSLEDRIVKNIFKEYCEVPDLIKGDPYVNKDLYPKYKLITKKPVIPSNEEINNNSRSKSAKMRVIERIEDNE